MYKRQEQFTANGGALLHEVREQGALLKDGLSALQRKYPNIIRAVRGRGLMLGLELGIERRHFAGSLLGVTAEQELLAPAVSAYLLNRETVSYTHLDVYKRQLQHRERGAAVVAELSFSRRLAALRAERLLALDFTVENLRL